MFSWVYGADIKEMTMGWDLQKKRLPRLKINGPCAKRCKTPQAQGNCICCGGRARPPRLRGEGRGEGASPQAQTRSSDSWRGPFTRIAQVRDPTSPSPVHRVPPSAGPMTGSDRRKRPDGKRGEEDMGRKHKRHIAWLRRLRRQGVPRPPENWCLLPPLLRAVHVGHDGGRPLRGRC